MFISFFAPSSVLREIDGFVLTYVFFAGGSPSQQQQQRYFVKVNTKPPGGGGSGGPFSSSALAASVPYNQLQPPQPPVQLQASASTTIMTQQQLYQHKNFATQQQQLYPYGQQQLQPYGQQLNSIHSFGGRYPGVCGVQPLKTNKLQKRIIGGDQAAFGEFPWQAHIRIAGFQCGGVLLNHQYIATAAHCVHRCVT